MSNFAIYGTSARYPDIASSKPFKYKTISVSSNPIVDLTTLKNALNITTDVDDDLLILYLTSATIYAENFTRRELREKQFLTFRDYFDYSNQYYSPFTSYRNDNFLLTKTDIDTLDTFQYLIDGVFTDVDSSLYYLVDDGDYKRIVLKNNSQYPTNKDNQLQSIKLEFTCNPSTVDNSDIINAIMMIVADLYANRGDCNCDMNSFSKSYVSGAARGILLQNRIELL